MPKIFPEDYNYKRSQNTKCICNARWIHIYIYRTFKIFLDSEDQLAGVLGHEIAHAANRHSTKQLTKIVGLQVLADAALGNKGNHQTSCNSFNWFKFQQGS